MGCGHEMKVIAIIIEPHEVSKILECLKRNNAPLSIRLKQRPLDSVLMLTVKNKVMAHDELCLFHSPKDVHP